MKKGSKIIAVLIPPFLLPIVSYELEIPLEVSFAIISLYASLIAIYPYLKEKFKDETLIKK